MEKIMLVGEYSLTIKENGEVWLNWKGKDGWFLEGMTADRAQAFAAALRPVDGMQEAIQQAISWIEDHDSFGTSSNVIERLKLTLTQAPVAPRDDAGEVKYLVKALEAIKSGDCVPWVVADEALKQHNGS